jgi:hypothetical protein
MVAKSQQQLLRDIASSDAGASLKAMRELKNCVIGNKSKKLQFVRGGAIPCLIELLSTSGDANLRVQSATALGSLGLVADGAREIVQHNGLDQLLGALGAGDPRLVEAAVRALKLILQSGQAPPPQALQAASFQRLAALLSSAGGCVAETAACVLASACTCEQAAQLITAAGAVPPLVALLASPLRGQQAAALAALAALAGHAPPARSASLGGAGGQGAAAAPAAPGAACQQLLASPAALQQLLAMLRDQQPRVKLLACSLASDLVRAQPPPPPDSQAAAQLDLLARLAVPALLRLLPEPDAKQGVPPVLAALLQARPELQAAACDAGAVRQLAQLLAEPGCEGRRLAGALRALGALCLDSEERRAQLAEEGAASAAVVAALDSPDAAVRAAGALCLRALTRSVRGMQLPALRAAGVAGALVRLLGDADAEVAANAAAAACNLALEFSPARDELVAAGGVAALAGLASSMLPGLRLNSCWALSNLAFQSSADLKRQVGRAPGGAAARRRCVRARPPGGAGLLVAAGVPADGLPPAHPPAADRARAAVGAHALAAGG